MSLIIASSQRRFRARRISALAPFCASCELRATRNCGIFLASSSETKKNSAARNAFRKRRKMYSTKKGRPNNQLLIGCPSILPSENLLMNRRADKSKFQLSSKTFCCCAASCRKIARKLTTSEKISCQCMELAQRQPPSELCIAPYNYGAIRF